MTTSSQVGRIGYPGNGVTVALPVPWKFFQNSDIRAVKQGVSGGDVSLTEGLHYTLTGAGSENGGTLTLTNAHAVGENITILLDPPLVQSLDYISNDSFPAEMHERGLDRLTQQNVRTREMVGRALRAPDGDPSFIPQLPPRSQRANRWMRFDSAGNPDMAASLPPGETLSRATIGDFLLPLHDLEDAGGLTLADLVSYWPYGDARRYGVICDGITVSDFTRAEAAHLAGIPIYMPFGPGAVADSTVTFAGDANVIMDSPIKFTLASVMAGLVIGSPLSANNRALRHELMVRRSAYSAWDDDTDIGILILNSFGNFIHIREATGWHTGIEERGSGGFGFTHNTVFYDDIYQNKIHLRVTGETGGYANQNRHHGGRFTSFGNSLPDNADKTGRRAMLLDSRDGSYVNHNNNVFIGPTGQVEGGTQFEFEVGRQNRITAARSEGGEGSYAVAFTGIATETEVDFEYAATGDSERVRRTSVSDASNIVTFGRYRDLQRSMREIFVCPSFLDAYCPYDANATTIRGMSFKRLVGSAANTFIINGGNIAGEEPVEWNGTDNCLDLSGAAVGVLVSVDELKAFTLHVGLAAGSTHFFLAQCFDATMTRLDATSSPGPYVVGSDRGGETFSATQQGAYRSSAGVSPRIAMRFKDEVKYAWIGVGCSTASGTAKLRSFRLSSSDYGSCTVTPGHSSAVLDGLVAVQSPQTSARGTWKRGVVVTNLNKSAAGVPGWACTTAGSGGATFKDLPALGA